MKKNNPKAPQEVLICPVCQKEFEPDENTKYLLGKNYTCDWKCFLNGVKEKKAAKEKEKRKEKEVG